MQIDWVTASIHPDPILTRGLEAFYETGYVVLIDPEGRDKSVRRAFLPVQGSHDNQIVVSTQTGHDLLLSGNPTKWFQGHNLFGDTDARGLFLDMGLAVRELVGLFPSPATWDACGFTGPRFSRVDITRSYRFPSDAHARAWIRSVAAFARSRHGAALFKSGTVYLGQNSRHWTLKIYLKSDELQARGRGHQLSPKLSSADRCLLTEWAAGVVRFELTLRSPELQSLTGNLNQPLLNLWQTYFDRIQLNANATHANYANATHENDIMTATMTTHELGIYALWRDGNDLRRTLSKPTFYRHRAALRLKLGVDIASPPPPRDARPVEAALDPAGWDPEPIEHLTHRPRPEVARQYPLLAS